MIHSAGVGVRRQIPGRGGVRTNVRFLTFLCNAYPGPIDKRREGPPDRGPLACIGAIHGLSVRLWRYSRQA
jgi:hypothetical protein